MVSSSVDRCHFFFLPFLASPFVFYHRCFEFNYEICGFFRAIFIFADYSSHEFNNLITVRLDSSNYALWNFQLSPLLCVHKLFGYLDGSISAPKKEIIVDGVSTPNPTYEAQFEKDQTLITLINATVSPPAIAYAIGCSTSQQIWSKLRKHFSSSTRLHIVGLKSDLQSITKLPTKSINAYVQRIKDIVNKLVAVSIVVDQEDLAIYALNRLPFSYNVFKTTVHTRSQNLTFEELHVLMIFEERDLEQQVKFEISSPPLAMVATANFMNSGTEQGNFGNCGRDNDGCGRSGLFHQLLNGSSSSPGSNGSGSGGRGTVGSNDSSIGNSPKVVCQICQHFSHNALDLLSPLWFQFPRSSSSY